MASGSATERSSRRLHSLLAAGEPGNSSTGTTDAADIAVVIVAADCWPSTRYMRATVLRIGAIGRRTAERSATQQSFTAELGTRAREPGQPATTNSTSGFCSSAQHLPS